MSTNEHPFVITLNYDFEDGRWTATFADDAEPRELREPLQLWAMLAEIIDDVRRDYATSREEIPENAGKPA